ncbi:MAG: N-acetylmannosamine-6-phosphate 2-epimerase [Candidatus Thermofonsia Clade 1 bacterium]|uniref:Putative N-acetylmannosamine-6-phosphate 2-epimerase n=1 Tax=Candidatus Thermofonsia Clade 1 bacterium TaxID=2364210 RepID=A0A2M8PE77_9CHLR|nr:MAG: N-acetylmannosamine-6-phosphate 2-epimerase [Candidatus Thermofonsia Clade 1 bacterium]PJF42738.1 MAG: N-acetylmannosamine-6-phosphate 2-epimerase [Candidatus Thermofonsia Clade 1 bacterium]RMF52552.1 MAG: N-acetylmannosamine-6-phosphate 2-epimerase [Chloroflexota bacterium]
MHPILKSLQGGLIVSCQAQPHSPVYGARFMAAFARCAEIGGACAIRANGVRDVRAVRQAVSLPIIGINKRRDPRYPVYITPTFASARQVVRAGAHIVALDATHRPRQGGASPESLIKRIREELGVLVMADIDTLEEAQMAEASGADMIATTLAGYTAQRARTAGADLELVSALAARLHVPVICEGRLATPSAVRAAFEAGAYAVVVGTAITNPIAITQAFVAALPKRP